MTRLRGKGWIVAVVWWFLSGSGSGYGEETLTPDFSAMRSTVHNISFNKGSDDLCVFCHTPESSWDEAIVPKWQATFSDPFFQSSDTLNPKRKNATAGSVSIMCLSCHTPDSALLGEMSSGVPIMQNQHPIGIPYLGIIEGGQGGNLDYGIARKGRYNEGDVWWVETGTPGFQPDDILLFPRRLDDGRIVPFVECSSCHDPHSTNPKFIRITESERLCQACHPNLF